MGRKYCSTGTVTLASSGANNTVIAAPNPLSDGGGPRENFIRRLWVERTDTATDVTLIFLNSASLTPRELVDAIERTQAQAQNYIAGLVAGMDVPEGWQLDPRRMAFVAPEPAAPAVPVAGENGA